MTRITDQFGREATIEWHNGLTGKNVDELLFNKLLYPYSEQKKAWIVRDVNQTVESTKEWKSYDPENRTIIIRTND